MELTNLPKRKKLLELTNLPNMGKMIGTSELAQENKKRITEFPKYGKDDLN